MTMRKIDLHAYPGTQQWIDCQGPYVEALAAYWKREWKPKAEADVLSEFEAAGVEPVWSRSIFPRPLGRLPVPMIMSRAFATGTSASSRPGARSNPLRGGPPSKRRATPSAI
jgi:hypothetical protein